MNAQRFASLSCAFAFSVVACSSTSNEDSPKAGNGVNDVLKACDIRTTWTHASSSVCSTCIGYATTPRCPCADADYAGKCSDQQAARTAEASCDGVDTCIHACDVTDCACVDACYANAPACRARASAVDGCVADVCAPSCR